MLLAPLFVSCLTLNGSKVFRGDLDDHHIAAAAGDWETAENTLQILKRLGQRRMEVAVSATSERLAAAEQRVAALSEASSQSLRQLVEAQAAAAQLSADLSAEKSWCEGLSARLQVLAAEKKEADDALAAAYEEQLLAPGAR